MSASTSKRLLAVVVAFLALVSCLAMRDTVAVNGPLSPTDVKAIVSGLQEWSAPKLFRHIEIDAGQAGTELEGEVLAKVREPGGRWSVTVFTKQTGAWKKCEWFLLEEDTAGCHTRQAWFVYTGDECES